MVEYSREFLQEYLDTEWLVHYNLISDEGYSAEEIEELYQKALSYELLKNNTNNKRIALPATAYLRLDKHEKAYKAKAEKKLERARPLADFQEAPEMETLGGWQFHDSSILSVTASGRTITVQLKDVLENPVKLVFSGATILENELPYQIDSEDYCWLNAEAVINNSGKKELHVLAEDGGKKMKLAIQYQKVLM